MDYQNFESCIQGYKGEIPLYDVDKIIFPLSTKGCYIVDATGRRVKLAGTNWSGSHDKRQCVGGLDKDSLDNIIQKIKTTCDFNVIRLTFSIQMVHENPIIDKKLTSANPQLEGKRALQIFDIVVEKLTKSGVMVFLNNHTSSSQWCCTQTDGDGLWYTKQFPEQIYFQALCKLAERYKNNERVIGMDIRNEIRIVQEQQNKYIIPTWGTTIHKTDWHKAAQEVSHRIQEAAPHLLIIVGGLNYQLNLKPVRYIPIKLKIPNKLVYSGHLYSFSWSDFDWSSYQKFEDKYYEDQLFVRDLGVPYLLGEFGQNNVHAPYWQFMIQLIKKTDLDFTQWCLDGYKKCDQENETYGLLTKDFKSIRSQEFLHSLKSVSRPTQKNQ